MDSIVVAGVNSTKKATVIILLKKINLCTFCLRFCRKLTELLADLGITFSV